VTETCARPLESLTWLTTVQAVTSRCSADPARLAATGAEAFIALVRAGVGEWGGKKAHGPIIARIFGALTDAEGVVAPSRRGLLRRCADELGDLQRTRAQLRQVEADMAGALEELGLSRLAGIPGLTAVGAAAILAETGDPRRYDTSSSLVKHSGMSPSDNASGAFYGQARISRRGRPGLRLAVWRAVWPMLQYNPVMAAKYQAMTASTGAAPAAGRDGTGPQQVTAAAAAARARRAKARVACAAALLRWIYYLVVYDAAWDTDAASATAAASPAEAA
jgi:transposase